MTESERGLQKNAIGVWQIVFFVIAAAAPLTAMLGGATAAIAIGNGVGVPGTFVIAGAILLLFSVGYAHMSRFITNSGAFYAYIAQGLGRPMGVGAAAVAILSYMAIQLALYGLFGFFAAELFNPLLGIAVPWFAWALVALVGVLLLGVRRIDLNGKVLGLLLLLEIGILLVFDVAVLLQGGSREGLSLASFAPAQVFSGAFGISLMFAMACFVGFEATALYSEEARDPKRTIPRATYLAVTIIALFYALSSWAVVNAHGAASVVKAATDDAGGFWFAVNSQFVGTLSTDIMGVLLVTSIFASLVAFHNAITRYFYSMGREGLLPAALADTHPRHRSPYKASYAQTILALLGILAFVVLRADPFLIMFSWMSALAVIGIIALQLLVSLSVIQYFRQTRKDSRAWPTVIAPLLSSAGLAYALFLVVQNLPALSGSESPAVRSFPYVVLIVLLLGVSASLWLRSRRPTVYQRFASLLDDL